MYILLCPFEMSRKFAHLNAFSTRGRVSVETGVEGASKPLSIPMVVGVPLSGNTWQNICPKLLLEIYINPSKDLFLTLTRMATKHHHHADRIRRGIRMTKLPMIHLLMLDSSLISYLMAIHKFGSLVGLRTSLKDIS
jgi:hypothetical protein